MRRTVEPRELLGRELSVLPVKFGALAWQWQVEREVAGDPAVAVAGEHERAAFAHEVDDGHRVGGAEADDVAQAPDLIHARAVDRGGRARAPEGRRGRLRSPRRASRQRLRWVVAELLHRAWTVRDPAS